MQVFWIPFERLNPRARIAIIGRTLGWYQIQQAFIRRAGTRLESASPMRSRCRNTSTGRHLRMQLGVIAAALWPPHRGAGKQPGT